MPKARQRYLLAKFTSMKKLKLFLDVAETARQQVRPLQHQLYAHIDEHCRVSHGVIEFDTEIAPFFQQRLEARDHSLDTGLHFLFGCRRFLKISIVLEQIL